MATVGVKGLIWDGVVQILCSCYPCNLRLSVVFCRAVMSNWPRISSAPGDPMETGTCLPDLMMMEWRGVSGPKHAFFVSWTCKWSGDIRAPGRAKMNWTLSSAVVCVISRWLQGIAVCRGLGPGIAGSQERGSGYGVGVDGERESEGGDGGRRVSPLGADLEVKVHFSYSIISACHIWVNLILNNTRLFCP